MKYLINQYFYTINTTNETYNVSIRIDLPNFNYHEYQTTCSIEVQ